MRNKFLAIVAVCLSFSLTAQLWAECSSGNCSRDVSASTVSRTIFVDQNGNQVSNPANVTTGSRSLQLTQRDFVNQLDSASVQRSFNDNSGLRQQVQSLQQTVNRLNRTIELMQSQQRGTATSQTPRLGQGASTTQSKGASLAGLFRPIRGGGGSKGGCRADVVTLASSTERPIRGGTKDGDGCGGKLASDTPSLDQLACDNTVTREFVTREVQVPVTREVRTVREVQVPVTREVVTREVQVPVTREVTREVIVPEERRVIERQILVPSVVVPRVRLHSSRVFVGVSA